MSAKKPNLKAAQKAVAKVVPKPKKKAAAKKPKIQPTKIDWAEAQKFYLMDATASYSDVAKEFGVSKNTVTKHANAMGWSDLRNKLTETSTNLMIKRLASKKTGANDRHYDQYKTLEAKVMAVINKLNDDADPGDLMALARALKVATDGERVVLGLPTNINAVTGKDGDNVWNGFTDMFTAAGKVLDGAQASGADTSAS
jgi:hypothetical protein